MNRCSTGYRLAEIAMQEAAVKSAIEENKLKSLERSRSGKPPDMKQLELNISAAEPRARAGQAARA